MRLKDSDIRGLPVVTKSGARIGAVAGLVVDVGRQEVVQYAVRKAKLLSAILPEEVLVHRDQVIEMDAERMVVEDAAVAEKAEEAVRLPERAAAETGGSHAMKA